MCIVTPLLLLQLQTTTSHKGKNTNLLLDTDADKENIRRSLCKHFCMTQPAANINSFMTLSHTADRCFNITVYINTAGVVSGAT